MIPNFFIFNKEVSAYMIAAMLGVFACIFVTYKLAKRSGSNEITMLTTMLIALASSLVGSHLLYGITNMPIIVAVCRDLSVITSFSVFWTLVQLIFGGSVYYGGLITGMLGGYIYLRHKKIRIAPYADIGAIGIPLFHFFGRVGCFLSGCCYGIPWSSGVTYHHALVDSANGIPRFPVQLVEAVLNLALFILLLVLFKKQKAKGKLLALYLIIYPFYRFMLEFLRDDGYRGFLFGLSTSQIISVLLFVPSVIWLIISCRRKGGDGSAA
ncbi:MAG: prolipoprotein diacylglyceryl transferase [Clostridia bacterium]|nr:prolipoprotein diacylglyceryl transferase [Clostridia bacterium]